MASLGLRQTAKYGLGLAAVKLTSFMMLPYMTQKLSPQEFGELEVLMTLAALSSILVGFGLVNTLYRFSAQASDAPARHAVVANVFGLTLVIGAVALVLSQCASSQIAALLPGKANVVAVSLILVTLALEGVISIPLAWMRLQERADGFLLLNTSKELLQAALVVVALANDQGVVGVVAAGAAASVLLACVLSVRQYKETGVRFELTKSRALLQYGYPMIVSGLAGFVVMGLDRWILGDSAGMEALGAYAIALKFAVIAAFLMQPYGMWWFPRRIEMLTRVSAEENMRYICVGISAGVLAATAVGIFSPTVIRLALPASYFSAIEIVPWLVMARALKHVSEMVDVGCFVGEKTYVQMFIHLFSAVLAAVGFWFFIPAYGIKGAVVVSLGVYLVRAVLFFRYSQQKVRLPYPVARIVALLVGSFAGMWCVGQVAGVSLQIGCGLLTLLVLSAYAIGAGLLPDPRNWISERSKRPLPC